MAPKRIVLLAWVGVALLSAQACKMRLSDAEVVARVNDEAVSKKDFDEQLERNMTRYRGQAQQLPPGIEARIQESVLRRMVEDEIIAQKAKALGIAVTQAEVDAKFQENKARFANDQAFADYMKRSSNSEANLKDDLRRTVLRDQVIDKLTGPITVTEADVETYYTENAPRFHEPEQIRARRIVIRVPADAAAKEKAAKLKVAQKIRASVAKPGADFGKVAHEVSEAPEAPRDGEMGGFFARGHMPPDFDNAAFALPPNAISQVAETTMGYEIIQVLERKPERQKPLDEVKENIRNALLARSRNDKRRDALRDLKANAKVETLIKFDKPPAAAGPAVATPMPATPPTGAPAPAAAPPPAGGLPQPATGPGGVPPPAAGGAAIGPTPAGGAPPPSGAAAPAAPTP